MTDNRRYLTLVLDFKWYDMIASGVKLEEYREFKPFYQRQLLGRAYQPGEKVNINRVRWELETHAAAKYRGVILRKGYNTGEELKKDCIFRFDYGKNSRYAHILCGEFLRIPSEMLRQLCHFHSHQANLQFFLSAHWLLCW